MKTFEQWLLETHPETLEEGLGRNLLTYGLMGLGALGASGCSGGKCSVPKPQQQITQKSVDWADYTSPDGIKVALGDTNFTGNTAVVSIPIKMANQLGGNAQKKALATLASYLQRAGGMKQSDTMRYYHLKDTGRDGNDMVFNFQQSYP